jgi:hypothetical protein
VEEVLREYEHTLLFVSHRRPQDSDVQFKGSYEDCLAEQIGMQYAKPPHGRHFFFHSAHPQYMYVSDDGILPGPIALTHP